MTVAHLGPMIAAPDVETAIAAVRRQGLRLSTARRLIIEALFEAGGPTAASEIAGSRSLDLPTVYANLETLEQIGLVSHVHLGHGPGRYQLRDRIARDFLQCERCGDTVAVEASVLAPAREAIREATGFSARFDHFPVMGLCAGCRATGPG